MPRQSPPIAFLRQISKKGIEAKKQAVRANIMAQLTIVAGKMAQRARDNVRSLKIPQDIANAISVGEPRMQGDGTFIIDVTVDLGDPNALGEARQGRAAARAFEYGSGVHSTRGKAETYVIKPREAPALAFPFVFTGPASSAKLIGGVVDDEYLRYGRLIQRIMESDDGAVLADPSFWNYVDHPGVEPSPFLRPAIDSVRGELVSNMAKAFAQSFVEESYTYTVNL